ncbi:M28 family peptidase [Arsenicitalea aurantiaca]|uniref:M28 family peptidase n=1 Tax=Arsenicitalea aurantiaca TaxID=1783274 RepID=A0A433XB24_9HYPH|nr:M28 family peptidase [Arsenicitalea aurantiaca]RUT31254.1 M28 family peptidase [Arsenicitalea aurantiaca]
MGNLQDKLLASISVDEMWKHLEKLCEWDRSTGTEGELAAVDYVKSVLESYGLPVTVHEYRAYISHPISGGLTVEMGGETVKIPAKTRAFSANTPEAGLSGALVSIQGGKNMFKADNAVNLISPETVGGKIVLSESGSRGSMLAAKNAGAVGYIHMWPSDEDVIHEGIVTPVWGTPTPESAGNIPNFPIISIKHNDGVRLRAALEKGEVKGTIHSVTKTGWANVKMPVTEIKGQDDDFVLVAGHIDSWHYGATDNATGNVSCMELARVLKAHEGELRRGVRIAWWVGHSTGRYSGSTWYADHHWAELDANCVAYINIDSPGSLGATDYSEVTAVPETAALVTNAVKELTGQTPNIDRPMRAGDQSFWGVGLPSLFMLLSNRPEGQRAAVGGCGMGWWWHAEEDLVDKADRDVLLKDTQIYAHALLRLTQDEVLPLDLKAQIADLKAQIAEVRDAAGEHFDVSSVNAALGTLDAEIAVIGSLPADKANALIKTVSHRLTALSFTYGDRFDHDPAMPLPMFPALDGARKLAKLDPESNDYGFLQTRLVRNRNMVNHEINTAIAACRAAK